MFVCCCLFNFIMCKGLSCVCRYMGRQGQPLGLRPWRSPEMKENGTENGLSDPAYTPDEPKSEPLPERPSFLPTENGGKKSILYRQQSLVILTGRTPTPPCYRPCVVPSGHSCLPTEPQQDKNLPISTVKTQEILQGNVVRESAEGHGTIE